MSRPIIALQAFTLRDTFVNDPLKAFQIAKEIGYEAMDIFMFPSIAPAEKLKEYSLETGIPICANNVNWGDILPENIEKTLRFNEEIGNKRIAIGSAPVELLGRRTALKDIIKEINVAYKTATDAGFQIGYHTHFTDFKMSDGVSAWDRILENTPDDFYMILDTGNAAAGGGDSLHYLKKYPNRTPWIHLKPFCRLYGSYTTIGQDSFDWDALLKSAVEDGKADTFVIEYSAFSYDTQENNARRSYNELVALMNK